jgi:3-isopropylmalate/(R)-2-methylmalate dehydratase small subunit
MGFPLATCPGIRAAVQRWDELRVDWALGHVSNLRTGQALALLPLSSSERGTLEAGGLIPYLKNRLATEARPINAS